MRKLFTALIIANIFILVVGLFTLWATKPAFAQEPQQPVVFQTGEFTITDTISTSDNTGYLLKYGDASGNYTQELDLAADTANVPFSDLQSGPGATIFGILESDEGHKTNEFTVSFVGGMLKICIQAYLPDGSQVNQCFELVE